MAKVILINPSISTAGYSFITPRMAVTVFNRYYREKRMRLQMTVMPTKLAEPLNKTSIQSS